MIKKDKFKVAVAEIARSEVIKNFEVGGRFGEGKFGGGENRWKRSRRAIQQNGKTLIDTGILMGTIEARVNENKEGFELILYAGTDYAETHQFGKPEKHIVARPFLTLPDSFENEVVDIAIQCLDENEIRKKLL